MLISESYRVEQERLHERGGYGTSSLLFGETVSGLVKDYGHKTLLDYGCGSKQNLKTVLDCDVRYQGYDPGTEFREKSPADLVCCIDVLEHIEPECLYDVLKDIASLALKQAFISVHTGPALKTLSDGRNAHLIQQPAQWWFPRISAHLRIDHFQRIPDGFIVICL